VGLLILFGGTDGRLGFVETSGCRFDFVLGPSWIDIVWKVRVKVLRTYSLGQFEAVCEEKTSSPDLLIAEMTPCFTSLLKLKENGSEVVIELEDGKR